MFQGGLDYAQCERVWGSADWPERIASWFVRHGAPAAVAEDLIAQGHAFAPFIRYAVEPDLLYEGSEVDGWQVLELPGHADGHLGFLRDGVLIAGDHLLQRISPAVGLYPESRPDPLGDYLASLERTIELAPRIVYPGHGEPILDAGVRARELIEHHRRRLDETAEALGDEPRSAYEISLDVGGRRAIEAIAAAHDAGRLPIVVGGTGLYLRALTHGLAPVPDIPPEIREEAAAQHRRARRRGFSRAAGATRPAKRRRGSRRATGSG